MRRLRESVHVLELAMKVTCRTALAAPIAATFVGFSAGVSQTPRHPDLSGTWVRADPPHTPTTLPVAPPFGQEVVISQIGYQHDSFQITGRPQGSHRWRGREDRALDDGVVHGAGQATDRIADYPDDPIRALPEWRAVGRDPHGDGADRSGDEGLDGRRRSQSRLQAFAFACKPVRDSHPEERSR
jgi:hypothetical protein